MRVTLGLSKRLRRNHRQLYRFILVGCLNVAISFAVYIACYHFLADPSVRAIQPNPATPFSNNLITSKIETMAGALANLIGYAAGMVSSFTLNKIWTFEAGGDTLRQFRRFLILNLVGLLTSTALVFVFVDQLGGPYLQVWLAATVVVMALNFLGNKFWTFAESGDQAAAS